jgi:ribosome biogenesis GTPase
MSYPALPMRDVQDVPENVENARVRDLHSLGWNEAFRLALEGLADRSGMPGRVFDARRGVYSLVTEQGTVQSRVAGRFRHRASATAELPAIGDWVVFRPDARAHAPATIHAVLPRQTKLARKVAGERSDEQVLAANVDAAIILMGVDGDLNLRRLDRYVAMARSGGVHPLVLLTKVDLLGLRNPDLDATAVIGMGTAEAEARQILKMVVDALPGVLVVPVSLLDAELPGALLAELRPARTIALLGSSGVGKSTLLNRLVGDRIQRTAAVRISDSRGRHTTTHRQMFALPGGALVIDSPGLREIQLHASEPLPDDAFPDIAKLALACKFRDCQHDQQPGCAVEAAVARGELAAHRAESHRRLRLSQAILARRPVR